MKYKKLGRTGLCVSEICLGSMTFGGGSESMWKTVGGLDQGAVNAIIGRAMQAGVNFIDTADVYAKGESEQTVSQALKDLGVACKDVVGSDGYILFKVTALVTYEGVTSIQRRVTAEMMPFGGICDSWGVWGAS